MSGPMIIERGGVLYYNECELRDRERRWEELKSKLYARVVDLESVHLADETDVRALERMLDRRTKERDRARARVRSEGHSIFCRSLILYSADGTERGPCDCCLDEALADEPEAP